MSEITTVVLNRAKNVFQVGNGHERSLATELFGAPQGSDRNDIRRATGRSVDQHWFARLFLA